MGVPGLSTPNQLRRNRRRITLSLPFIAAILLLVFIQFSIIPQLYKGHTPSSAKLSELQRDILRSGLEKCAEINTPQVQYEFPVPSTRSNPRWNPSSGQKKSIMLKNATLFDGDTILDGPVNVLFSNGVVQSISPLDRAISATGDVTVIDLAGKFVTPGLVDMHSHHLTSSWPASISATDDNEVNPAFGPLTPFVRSLDGMKPYDLAIEIIASGGVTSSLILPGSANIMGGQAWVVKNLKGGGEHGEEVVEEMLLEHGVPLTSRRRYMKMACGENPSRVYDHTRMGNAWILRKHMARAKDLMEKQDQWCLSAAAALESSSDAAIAAVVNAKLGKDFGLPEELELDSTMAMLRGKININVHCYEPEDFEDMILHSKEFGFRIRAFHHALSAWKVPELIKDSGYNITIATFSEFGLFKQEGYGSNLWAGKILSDHSIPVAYKSDHAEEETNAKYLMFQAATAHAFKLPEILALKSVTSVPAKSLDINHRVGYVREGYDADIVVWNLHPLRVGATPLQVYIDGKATLDPAKVAETMSKMDLERQRAAGEPVMRKIPEPELAESVRKSLEEESDKKIIITGIKKSFLTLMDSALIEGDLTMVISSGKLECFGSEQTCASSATGGIVLRLESGYVLPGLTALSTHLGLAEIDTLEETADGEVSDKVDMSDPDNVIYAKYGIHLDGKAFKRARIGGVTRAVTAPMTNDGLLDGVSVGIITSGKKTILNGGIFQDDVALHFVIGQEDKGAESTTTVSTAISKFRKILIDNEGKDSIYGRAANGTIPVVVHAESKYDIMQLIKIKKDHTKINLVINGGEGAPAVAHELAAAKIPVILNPFRGAPAQWQTLDSLPGPPLSKSSAQVLSDAGVTFGIAMGGSGDSHIHNLPVEASWAAKYAGLSDHAAVDLVSKNIEQILGIEVKEEERDIVVFEGNPLELGASVVLSIDGTDKSVMDFWPEAQ